ncbi:MAG: hypothetical protein WA610_04300 [Thermodesulfovibrionales bacterium]
MATLSESEKIELLRLAGNHSLKKDMEHIAAHRHNPVVIDGEVDLDRLIEFLTQYNEFINHERKAFTPIDDSGMKL